jgi:hypothetical protein
MSYRPRNLRVLEKHTEEGGFPETYQDTTYSQNVDDPTPESNPAGNPNPDPYHNVHHSERIDREELLRNIDKLNNVELVRLSRASYLSWSNRYNVRNH